MINALKCLSSPAFPAILLVYGIVFCFAVFDYFGVDWNQKSTISFYLLTLVIASVIVFIKREKINFKVNFFDFLFIFLFLLILFSCYFHWWAGTEKYLLYMPFFFVFPYVLGKIMGDTDVLFFRKLLIFFGSLLILLILLAFFQAPAGNDEYIPVPLLFGHSHAPMLSGLLLSATLLALVALLSSSSRENGRHARSEIFVKAFACVLVSLLIFSMGWISSRGSIVAAALSVVILLCFSSFSSVKVRAAIFLYLFASVVFTAGYALQNASSTKYYGALLQGPSVLQDANAALEKQSADLRQGAPILGKKSCETIQDSVSDRWLHYQQALAMFVSRPLFGVGANSYGFYSCTGPGWFPHSTILQIFAELGLAGGLPYCALIFMSLRIFLRRTSSAELLPEKQNSVWVLAFMVLQLTISQFYGNYFMSAGLYFSMGLASSFIGQEKLNKKRA